MNEILNKFLLVGDKFMSEMNLEQPGFTYSAGETFTKHRERVQKFILAGNLKHSYRNQLDRACFAHDAAYSDSKDLTKRRQSDKIFRDKAYEIASNPKYD